MKHFFLTLFFLTGTVCTLPLSAIHPAHAPMPMDALAMNQSMTVNDFLAIDIKGYKSADGNKLKWTQRIVLGQTQKNLAKKVKKGKIEGTATMDQAVAAGGTNTYGLLSVIFSVAGLVVPYLGLALIVAGLVLGIIGIKRDANPTLAIIGTVISGASLLLLLLVIVAFASGSWRW